MSRWIVKCDGGCPANPGPGAWAFVVNEGQEDQWHYSGFLPHPSTTNNQSEYRAVTAACIKLCNRDTLPNEIEIQGDSQLIVFQLTGKYRVSPEMRKLYDEAFNALATLRTRAVVRLKWIPREENSFADELCNQVLAQNGIVIKSKTAKANKRQALSKT